MVDDACLCWKMFMSSLTLWGHPLIIDLWPLPIDDVVCLSRSVSCPGSLPFHWCCIPMWCHNDDFLSLSLTGVMIPDMKPDTFAGWNLRKLVSEPLCFHAICYVSFLFLCLTGNFWHDKPIKAEFWCKKKKTSWILLLLSDLLLPCTLYISTFLCQKANKLKSQ